MKNNKENPVLKLNLDSSNQKLVLFGSKHTNDFKDEQFSLLKKLWQEFLSNQNDELMVFTEGNVRDVEPTYEKSISKLGEVGAIQWLATQSEVDVICPEPNDREQRMSLCKIFDPDVVAYTFIVQNLTAWFRYGNKGDFNDAVKRSVNREKQYSEIYKFEPNIHWFEKQHQTFFKGQLVEDTNFLNLITDPRRNDTQINAVVSNRTKIRNEYVLKKISSAWNNEKSIFIVYGRGHFNFLSSKLKEMLQ